MENKKWYSSKTIWGIMIAAIGFVLTEVLKVPNVTLPNNADFDQLKIYADAIKSAQNNTGVIIGQVMSLLGTILGIYGRIKSEGKLV